MTNIGPNGHTTQHLNICTSNVTLYRTLYNSTGFSKTKVSPHHLTKMLHCLFEHGRVGSTRSFKELRRLSNNNCMTWKVHDSGDIWKVVKGLMQQSFVSLALSHRTLA